MIDLEPLRRRVSECESRVSGLYQSGWLTSQQARLEELRTKTMAAGFWNDQTSAAEIMGGIARIEADIASQQKALSGLDNARTAIELLVGMPDPELEREAVGSIEHLEHDLQILETTAYFSGPYDASNAILSLSSGAGGTDAQDWTEMLMRMYTRYAERQGFEVLVTDYMQGEEAGIKGCTLVIRGPYAYGLLMHEKGVHRLVRISPFDANKRRHTSFAAADVIPEIPETNTDADIPEGDLRIDVFHASGHGGQNVQKVSTAVRITHIPTGISASCQNERSQLQNKRMAMAVLKSRLLVQRELQRDAQISEVRGAFKSAEWGNEIRSYVLQPYKLAKDHRTGLEKGNVDAVLDGDLQDFILASVRHDAEDRRSSDT
ncbi:peptide chain release factor 2 [Candidatus Cryosericum hinesii]|jgi:peptide chain release factor 2|uniref:Peptide chain release factor 2 n=1 Tax=Candidatus Cryosericum hinesii TaxID=2290915 RepID=A0A398DSI1_9BACT|nr:peptide chain release factor 2 [Candidatus Cryosericum hinesii]RIE09754.1 peptide chain release factor 2 [Candidatus Cryosericum hinesii]RIE13661.1 peptide chain release factor 2 [Candidatus Cryosericum hinesii]RIE13690.1 peptide chain release factor 2 [Candidatus Cryosericum hinesii]